MVETLSKNPLADALIRHDLARVAAFRSGIFRMSAVHIETAPVRQHFIELPVVVGVRPFPLSLDLKSPGIEQRIFILVVPDGVRHGNAGIMSYDRKGIGDRIGRRRIPGGDAELRFGSEYARSRRGCGFPHGG